MPLDVITCCYYFTIVGAEAWTDDDYNANKFVKALKGKPLNGYAEVPVAGERLHLAQENAGDAFGWFARMVRVVPIRKRSQRLGFVPVPSSSSTKNVDCTGTTTHRMVQALAGAYANSEAVDLLRWKKAMIPASQRGPRDPEELFPNLVLIGEVDDSLRYVLVDDVLTSGGHLQACAARLRRAGAAVALAMCAGRSTHEQRKPVFGIVVHGVPDWDPDE